jgi:hypothetical protein
MTNIARRVPMNGDLQKRSLEEKEKKLGTGPEDDVSMAKVEAAHIMNLQTLYVHIQEGL